MIRERVGDEQYAAKSPTTERICSAQTATRSGVRKPPLPRRMVIWVSSSRLPLKLYNRKRCPNPAGEVRVVNTAAPSRILIAEDNAQGAELLEAFLGETPHETKVAANGEDALRIVAEWKPDIVLLDIMMPRLSGFEVCRKIRANPATRDIGIIMVTALDQHADIDRAVDVGTDDFLTKPIHKAEFCSVSGHCCGPASKAATCRGRLNTSARSKKTCRKSFKFQVPLNLKLGT